MRLIDADAFSAFLKDAVIKQKYDHLSIDNALTVADVLQAVCADLDGAGLEGFKNAPTVDAVPVDDVFGLAIALSKGIEVLELPTRVYNALSRSVYRTVADVYVLWKSGNLKKLWNLGDKSIGVVEDRLCEYLPYLWRTEGR